MGITKNHKYDNIDNGINKWKCSITDLQSIEVVFIHNFILNYCIGYVITYNNRGGRQADIEMSNVVILKCHL